MKGAPKFGGGRGIAAPGNRGDGRGGGSDAWAAGASSLEGSWPRADCPTRLTPLPGQSRSVSGPEYYQLFSCDFALVSFCTLAVEDQESVLEVTAAVDKATGYVAQGEEELAVLHGVEAGGGG